jgi:cation transport ATPase
MKTKILSSIPGRMRIKIERLLHNENTMYLLEDSLHSCPGIVLVSPNITTGNMVVYYDAQLVDSLEISKRISSTNIINCSSYDYKDCTKQLYKSNKIFDREKSLSSRLLTLSVIISGLALSFSFGLEVILSVMILGFPGILLLIHRAVYKTAQKNLKYNKFDFRNPNLLYELSEVKHLLIEDTVLRPVGPVGGAKDFNSLFYDDVLQLIKKFRNLGLLDITMISRQNNDINSYISYLLGINKIELDDKLCFDKVLSKSIKNKGMIAIILKNNDLRELRKAHIIVFQGYKEKKPAVDDFVIAFRMDDVNKIPYVIDTSKYCNKLVIRKENIAVTVNIVGIFFAITKFITPLSSIALYFTNYLVNTIHLTNQLAQYEKEHFNEI